VVVLTPELPDLADYRVTHSGVAVLTEAVKFLAGQRQHVTSERVALLGFSFGGGLSLLAAAEPGISSHLRLVASVGGYHDLERVLRFYVSGEADTPEGSLVLRPHEYGLVVLAYSHIDQLVPTEDVDVMRHALREWLQEDRDSARGWASQSTSEESERLFQLLEAQRLPELRAEFEALIDQDRERLHLLSPSGVLERVDVPVHLLHSASDTVIPPSETRWASVELAHHRHSTLVSPLLGHAALDRDADRSLTDSLELVWFMSQVL
jgi:pimeloyl-ACP methyl ester carboxylesterase